MSSANRVVHGRWSSHFAYILAATGAAVGLGNIWKFPYIMGENGGGAFVIVYLLCIAFIGLPVMMAEVLIGKRGRQSPGNSVKFLVQETGASKVWNITGWIGVLAGYLVLSFYVVIAGWALAYVFKAGAGNFVGQNPEQIGSMFEGLLASPTELITWTVAILASTVLIVGKGVQKGLENAVRKMIPILLFLLIAIAIYAGTNGDFGSTIKFMFYPDFSKLTINGVMVALGHAFFTLGLASGVMIMFGAYLPEKTSIASTSIWIAFFDTFVALLAGLAIFPIVFGNGLEPSAGPGLIFQTLPIAFGEMPFGTFFGTLFFVMLVVAAFTSAIGLIEASVAWLIERRGLTRWQAAMSSGVVLLLMSMGHVYSFAGAEWAAFELFGTHTNIFETVDYLTANVLLPIGGLIIAMFVAWVMDEKVKRDEIGAGARLYSLWQFSLKWIAPIAIALVFLQAIGLVTF